MPHYGDRELCLTAAIVSAHTGELRQRGLVELLNEFNDIVRLYGIKDSFLWKINVNGK